MAKTHEIQVFEVEGRWLFPMDMLRYDQCWPAGAEDAAKLTNPIVKGGEPPTRIKLCRAVRYQAQLPTRGRWASFGWTVTRVYTEEESG